MSSLRELHLIAHDIRSAQNIGSLFRLADSIGIQKIWISGISPTPSHPFVKKTALGSEKTVTWEKKLNIIDVIQTVRLNHFRVIGLEIDPRAKNINEFHPAIKMALLLGNEVEGIAPSLRDLCDDLIYISQKGIKESMNVASAASIASYMLLHHDM